MTKKIAMSKLCRTFLDLIFHRDLKPTRIIPNNMTEWLKDPAAKTIGKSI